VGNASKPQFVFETGRCDCNVDENLADDQRRVAHSGAKSAAT
jgi:hypothetical protein